MPSSLLTRIQQNGSKSSSLTQRSDSSELRESPQENLDERWEEIKVIWQNYKFLYVVMGFLCGILVFPLIQLVTTDLAQFLQSLVPEAVGIGFTVVLIDTVYRQREAKQAIQTLKDKLLLEAGSTSNETAKTALDAIAHYGWIHGKHGLLKQAMLYRANWQDARLSSANLEGATLCRANLKGAWLKGADLKGTNLWEARFDHSTVMPDGTSWTENTNLTNFGAVLEEPSWINEGDDSRLITRIMKRKL